MPATQVEAVAASGDIVPVPHAPVSIVGLVAIRSRLLTLIDVAAVAGEPDCALLEQRLMIITTIDGHGYGLQVDSVDDVIELGAMREPPKNLAAGWQDICCQMADHQGQLYLIVNPADVIAAATRFAQSAA